MSKVTEPAKIGLDFDDGLLSAHDRQGGNSGVDFNEEISGVLRTGFAVRSKIGLPELSEPEVVRHFTRISQENYSIDTGFYPLGSCTMKYNPKLNEKVARFPGFANIHPLQPEETVQGALEVMHDLQNWLAALSGLPGVSLNPAAGAHGEFAGIKVIKASHKAKGDMREYVLVPDSAHGTNPSTASGCGYKIINIKSDAEGYCDLAEVKKAVDEHGTKIAALMLTNPSTCGKFEKNVQAIADLIHSIGAYFYCDGANFNAIVGRVRPADFGVDVMHFNLHKTFSTPHGGGGPGCGPIATSEELRPFLPVPFVEKKGDKFTIIRDNETTIGQIKGFYGQFALMVRALSYMSSMGKDGFRQVSSDAVLSANYILAKLKDHYHVPFAGYCMHECLLTDKYQKAQGVTTVDVAKALIEYGFHPMTIYFPLIVQGAMLIEPTETESKETLDEFINSMIWIAEEAKAGNGEKFKSYPLSTPRKRVDEVRAARKPVLTWG
jgi:glycine dehydrogenase subunit 2